MTFGTTKQEKPVNMVKLNTKWQVMHKTADEIPRLRLEGGSRK
jgi:hypothetical protein